MSTKSSRRPGRRRSAPQNRSGLALIAWVHRHSLAIFLLLTSVASVRIAATYPVFNHTIDEPAHIACGLQWLQSGVYRYETQHPPLARVAAAVGPYLSGRRLAEKALEPGAQTMRAPTMYEQGALILSGDHRYDRNLTLARIGILPFFWVASLVTYLWARRSCGEPAAALATLLFTFLPPVLAHAGLATTDMALTAFVGASFLASLYWLDRPNPGRSVLFGVATGLAVLSKFTALVFIPIAVAGALLWYLIAERHGLAGALAAARRCLSPFLLAAVVGFVVIWAGYRFSFGAVPFTTLWLPFPELYDGVKDVLRHNREGHPAYLLGMHSDFGWWYYFPVVLAVKTPLPFLALLAFGAIDLVRRRHRELRAAAAFSGAILFFCLFSHMDIGLRHVLPVYIGFSVVAAAGAAHLAELAHGASWARWTLGLLLLWMAGTSAFIHPDYLAYFNALAGDEPEKVLVDSDLDWGQDMKRLGKRLQEVGAREVTFNPFIVGYLEADMGFPPIHRMDPQNPAPGWNAVSLTELKSARLGFYKDNPNIQLWPELIKPKERVGKGVLLWYFPLVGEGKR